MKTGCNNEFKLNKLNNAQQLVQSCRSYITFFSPPYFCPPLQRGLLPGHHHWHGAHYEHVHSWAVWRHCHGEYKTFSLLPPCPRLPLPLCGLIVSVWTLFRFSRLTQSRRDWNRKGVRCLLEGHLQTGLAGSRVFKRNDICAGTPSTFMPSSLSQTPTCTKEYVKIYSQQEWTAGTHTLVRSFEVFSSFSRALLWHL